VTIRVNSPGAPPGPPGEGAFAARPADGDVGTPDISRVNSPGSFAVGAGAEGGGGESNAAGVTAGGVGVLKACQ